MNRETKTFHFEVKAVDDEQGLIEAYGSVFGNEDEGGDVVKRGAFTRTIKNSKARIAAGKANFLATMLWSHDPQNHLPIGGWTDLQEDEHGLLGKGKIILETQLGREVYTLIKEKVVNQFSIGYDIPQGGATYDSKKGIRELTELRLWEISPCVFAMNDESLLVDVKSMEQKSVCGNTSGPIGPRDESWDGGKAKGQIFAAAEKDDGSLDTALAKKYFMVCDGDAQKKGSYGYPFWYVGSDPHICVGACKAIAGAISGARGADAPSGLKSKVETLYKRISSKYPDDDPLTPPWKDDGKGSHMSNRQQKTFAENFAEEQAEDLLADWQDVYLCALTQSILEACQIGDTLASDASDALDAFKEMVMSKFVAQALEYNLPQYLSDNTYSSSRADSLMQYGSESQPNYGRMSRTQSLSRKAGRVISASNAGKIQDHIDSINDMADTHEKAMKTHTKALRSAADDLATVLQGSEAAYGSDTGKPDEGQQEGKNRGTPSQETRTTQQHSSQADTVDEQDITSILGNLKALHA